MDKFNSILSENIANGCFLVPIDKNSYWEIIDHNVVNYMMSSVRYTVTLREESNGCISTVPYQAETMEGVWNIILYGIGDHRRTTIRL